MAKAQPHQRIIAIASANEVSTIDEVEEAREAGVNRPATAGNNSRLPESGESTTSDKFCSAWITPVDTADELSGRHSTTADRGEKPKDNLLRVFSVHNEMEHELLLGTGKPPQCNGQSVGVRQDPESSGSVEDRAAIASPLASSDTQHLSKNPYSKAARRKHPKLASNRSLSFSAQGSHVHVVSKDSHPSIHLGSEELLPRPGSQSSLRHDEHAESSQQKLDADNKNQAKYGSTLSNFGVEYMRATGALGVRFKQLQKPHSQSQDSLNTNSQDPNAVNSLVTKLPVILPMHKNSQANKAASRSAHSPHHHVGYRLGQRKSLAERRRRLADYSCLFAVLGLTLMVVEMECTIAKAYQKDSIPSYVLKSLITVSTVILLILISVYHSIEVKLFVVDNCIEDWRITMSWGRIGQIVLELFICTVHPVPGAYYFNWAIFEIKTLEWNVQRVPVDLILSLPMFMRLYLVVRTMLLHSKLFTDASSRSIGALNKITFNTRFVLKTLMNIFPGTVLVVFMVSLWIISAWILRACECWHNPLLANLLNSLYMVAITFLSVGYGDFVPSTYCGRGLAVLSGLMGAGCTALVVAVIAKRLELTRAEKHVHNFMIENQLSKKLKDAAANVLRETWLIYKYTKLVKRVNVRRLRAHQRKFLQAINELRTVKLKQRKLADQANSLTDFAKTTNLVFEIVSDLRHNQSSNDGRLNSIEQTLSGLQVQVNSIPHALAQLLSERETTMSCNSAPETLLSPNLQSARLRHYDRNQNSFDSGP